MDTGIDVITRRSAATALPATTAAVPSARVAYAMTSSATRSTRTRLRLVQPVATPDPNPDDCGGHGTHVAASSCDDATNGMKGVHPR